MKPKKLFLFVFIFFIYTKIVVYSKVHEFMILYFQKGWKVTYDNNIFQTGIPPTVMKTLALFISMINF